MFHLSPLSSEPLVAELRLESVTSTAGQWGRWSWLRLECVTSTAGLRGRWYRSRLECVTSTAGLWGDGQGRDCNVSPLLPDYILGYLVLYG